MLWKKETDSENSMYTDLTKNKIRYLCKDIREVSRYYDLISSLHSKSDTICIQHLKDGNQKFSAKLWFNAMKCYNEALCYAQNGSELVGMAYGNRSSCFLALKMFKKCLIDIELAKQNNLPQGKFADLEKVKAKCLDLMNKEDDQSESYKFRLDFEANKRFPYLANVLNIQHGSNFRRIVATEDIDVGKIVIVEPSYHNEKYTEKYQTCHTCSKEYENFRPCKDCASKLLCPECYNSCENPGHEYCNVNRVLVRTISWVKNEFTDTDQLIAFIEKLLRGRISQIPDTFSDTLSNYCVFFKICKQVCECVAEHMFNSMYQALLDYDDIGEFFKTETHKRFLMHLVYHHLMIFGHSNNGCEGDEHHMSIFASYLNNTCTPNVGIIDKNGISVCVVVRPILKNEELFSSPINYLMSIEYRQLESKELYHFECKCGRCRSGFDGFTPLATFMDLTSDPNYTFFTKYSGEMLQRGAYNPQHIKCLIIKCCKVLQKHGRSTWDIGIGRMSEILLRLMKHAEMPYKSICEIDVTELSEEIPLDPRPIHYGY